MRHTDVQAQFQPRARESIQEFLALIERTRAPLHSNENVRLQLWAERFLAEIGYVDDLRRSEKDPETADNRVRNLKDLAASLDQEGGAVGAPAQRLETFLEELTLDSERAEEKELQKDAVTLITMHSCKGLEFAHVFVVGLEEGLLPHTRSKEEGTLDEERRLFYVAITRAMKTLTLSHCLARKKYGQPAPCHPSQFLKELPTELIEHAEAKGKQPVAVSEGKSRFEALRAAVS
jgi:superfamily I DNA/RNA helicase